MGLGGVVGSFQNDLLIFRGDLLPYLFAHDQNVGDHGVLVNGVDLAHFAVLAGGQCGFVVFGAVNDAGLQGGIHIAVRHGNGNAAQIVHHIGLGLHVLHADLQALQVSRGADGSVFGVERAGAGGVIGQGNKAVIAGREEEILHLLGVHDMVEILGIIKDIRQAECVVGFVVRCQTGGRNLGHGDNACLQLLQVLVFAAELAVGEDLDLDAAIGLFVHFLSKLGHGNVDGVGLGQAVGQRQNQWVFCAVAGVSRGAGCAAAGHQPGAQHSSRCQRCNLFEHFVSSFYFVSRFTARYIPIRSNCSNETMTSWSFLGLGYLTCTLFRRWL